MKCKINIILIVLFQSIMNTYNGKLLGYELWILRRNEVWKYDVIPCIWLHVICRMQNVTYQCNGYKLLPYGCYTELHFSDIVHNTSSSICCTVVVYPISMDKGKKRYLWKRWRVPQISLLVLRDLRFFFELSTSQWRCREDKSVTAPHGFMSNQSGVTDIPTPTPNYT